MCASGEGAPERGPLGRACVFLFTLPIRAYQRFISPLKPATCRFEPTCSHYALLAVRRHGALRGSLLAGWRILRCQPFSEPGPDPVPAPGAWRRALVWGKACDREPGAE